jgi:hypothetical protein
MMANTTFKQVPKKLPEWRLEYNRGTTYFNCYVKSGSILSQYRKCVNNSGLIT